MNQRISTKHFDKLNNSLANISSNLIELKPQKKTNWLSLFSLGLSIISLLATITWNLYNQSIEEGLKTYDNWQSYLTLAVNNPDLANGFTLIDGLTIDSLHSLSLLNKKPESESDSIAYFKYKKYAWFVAEALAAGEQVYTLQKNDRAWRATIKEAFRGHQTLFKAKVFNLDDYDKDFKKLVFEDSK